MLATLMLRWKAATSALSINDRWRLANTAIVVRGLIVNYRRRHFEYDLD